MALLAVTGFASEAPAQRHLTSTYLPQALVAPFLAKQESCLAAVLRFASGLCLRVPPFRPHLAPSRPRWSRTRQQGEL